MTDSVPKIIVIPAKTETPQEQEKKRNLRVAAYCRVSTDSEEQLTSYQNQLSYYTEKIMKEPNWTMAGVFADEGITGTSANKRKEFLRMIRQCRQGKIDLIVNSPVGKDSTHDDSYLRKAAIKAKVPYMTTIAAAKATATGIQYVKAHESENNEVKSLQQLHSEIHDKEA